LSEVKITTKTCIKCGIEKPVSEFCRNKNSKDGSNYCCKKCVQKKVFPNYLKSKKKKALLLSQGLKPCSKCNTYKPLNDFHKCKTTTDGLQSSCKQCRRSRWLTPTGVKKRADKLLLFAQGLKRCAKCNQIKCLSEFSLSNSSAIGVKTRCKSCINRNTDLAKRSRENKILFKNGNKRCNKCNKIKKLCDFQKNSSANDKYGYTCKDCLGRDTDNARRLNKNKILLNKNMKICSACGQIKPNRWSVHRM